MGGHQHGPRRNSRRRGQGELLEDFQLDAGGKGGRTTAVGRVGRPDNLQAQGGATRPQAEQPDRDAVLRQIVYACIYDCKKKFVLVCLIK